MKRGILASILLLTAIGSSILITPARASIPVDTAKEYSDTTFIGHTLWGNTTLYSSWINVSGVQLLYLATTSNGMLDWFAGLHYQSADGSDLFIGNTFIAFETYNDTNHNGIVDAPANSSLPTEVAGNLGNFSISQYSLHSIYKANLAGLNHYKWGISYAGFSADMPPNYPNPPGQLSVFQYNNITFGYDFYVNASTAHLKTSFFLTPHQIYKVDDGLGFSTGYFATVLVVKPSSNSGTCQTLIDRQRGLYSVCAGTKPSSGGSVNDLQLLVGASKVLEYLFGNTYQLNLNGTISTNNTTASIVPPDGAPPGLKNPEGYVNFNNTEIFARDFASLVIPDASQLNLTYTYASLIYRISYPNWSGGNIEQDPEIIAYLGKQTAVPVLPFPSVLLGISIITATLARLPRRKLEP